MTRNQFRLLLTNPDKALASGLQVTAVVEYHPDKDEDTFDQLLVSVGNKTIQIPLIGWLDALLSSEMNCLDMLWCIWARTSFLYKEKRKRNQRNCYIIPYYHTLTAKVKHI